MNKYIYLIIIFLLTGCYDKQEMNSIAILTASEINKIDNKYIINAQIVNPISSEKSANEEAPFIMYTGTGNTIQEAYRQIKLQSSRYLYPDHLRLIIINERLAKQDISEIIDFYLRDPSIRTEFSVLIGKNDDILKVTTPIDEVSAVSIYETLDTNQKYLGVTNMTTLNEMTSTLLNPNTEITIPSILLENNNTESDSIKNTENTKIKSSYKLGGLAIFKKNKLIGYLSNEQSITYNIIKNNIKNTIITYECEKDKYLTLEISSNKSKITTKNKKINIDINMQGTINEINCNINLNNTDRIQKELELYIKNKIKKDINYIRNNYNTDIFGFLDIIYKYDYDTYKEVKNNWYKSVYQDIEININTNIKIISTGSISEDIHEKN